MSNKRNKKLNNFKLQSLNPNLIISPKSNRYEEIQSIERFFLSLAQVFNDIKNLVITHDAFIQLYKKPTIEITPHNGEYTGIELYYLKLLASQTFAAIDLLRQNYRFFQFNNKARIWNFIKN